MGVSPIGANSFPHSLAAKQESQRDQQPGSSGTAIATSNRRFFPSHIISKSDIVLI